jgi:hypothetical protein
MLNGKTGEGSFGLYFLRFYIGDMSSGRPGTEPGKNAVEFFLLPLTYHLYSSVGHIPNIAYNSVLCGLLSCRIPETDSLYPAGDSYFIGLFSFCHTLLLRAWFFIKLFRDSLLQLGIIERLVNDRKGNGEFRL